MPDPYRGVFASSSLARHLMRGALGFGLIGSGFALAASAGPVALLLAPLGMVALRGCPMCWIAGLVRTVSGGRLERACSEDGCTLKSASPRSAFRPAVPAAPVAGDAPAEPRESGG